MNLCISNSTRVAEMNAKQIVLNYSPSLICLLTFVWPPNFFYTHGRPQCYVNQTKS